MSAKKSRLILESHIDLHREEKQGLEQAF
ncbi:hypothetical protein PI23P_11747 [Polaribacter irgensii 23-P]|uniref:Uncharacterized protein n=1 Tax=Polaribacter irgensii 23-P TaxID=313594 RepID=A4C1K2_9FLAO|nr:hypothetical protein PI23P_11747 [Polaribacter irgensii 23-P]